MPSRGTLLMEALAASALLCLAALLAAHPIFSVDFHWHLKLGDVIRSTGAIPETDLFSAVHPDAPYVQFNWLWDATVSWLHERTGLLGVRIAQTLALTASFGMLYFVARLFVGPASFALLLTAAGLLLFEDRFRARPDALTLGFIVSMFPLLLGNYRGASAKHHVFVFVLGLLWSNIHGGASLLLVLSVGALLTGAIGERLWLKRVDAPLTQTGTLLLAAGFGVALSPTLVPGMVHWMTAVQPQIQIGNEEWQPSYTMLFRDPSPAMMLVALGPTVVALLYVIEQLRRVRRGGLAAVDLPEWLLAGGYLILAHHAVRNSFLCILPLAFMLRRMAPRSGERILGRPPPSASDAPPPRNATSGAYGLAALLAVMTFHDGVLVGYGGMARAADLMSHHLVPDTYPTHAARFVSEAGIEGGINNDGRWGGYLIHAAWPRCGVLIDTRHHLKGAMWDVFKLSHDVATRPLGLELGMRRYGLELAVFRGPTFPLIVPAEGWVLLFKAGDQEVYQHVDGTHAAQNMARAHAWLVDNGAQDVSPPQTGSEYAETVTRLGALMWMKGPLQQERLQLAMARLADGDERARARGYRGRARLMLQAGDYRAALSDYRQAMELDAGNPRAVVGTALSALALGQPEVARDALSRMSRLPRAALSADERRRLSLLEARLIR